MKTVRQKVLSYLNKTHTASAREISRVLKMSVATVRHHLRVLVSDGRLIESAVLPHEKKGRPEKVYSLPQSALGDNLFRLSDALLEETGPAVAMDRIAKRIAGDSTFVNEPLAKRLNRTVEKLNEMNYHAHWEAAAEGPRLILGHCPYASIIEKHPELCVMDSALLEELTGNAAKQLTKIGHDGKLSCGFALTNKS
ncbi:MAG TPA: ArsR family transcriptional regulator [Anaerolineales bacterium]|nr:ArsR family transcriptional regulator [Anaerolineales bacterium]